AACSVAAIILSAGCMHTGQTLDHGVNLGMLKIWVQGGDRVPKVVYSIVPKSDKNAWQLRIEGQPPMSFNSREAAIREARVRVRFDKKIGREYQIAVHDETGAHDLDDA
ncbi:MAG: hypothetical protein ABI411_20310, partial [Tahibacter sp.]